VARSLIPNSRAASGIRWDQVSGSRVGGCWLAGSPHRSQATGRRWVAAKSASLSVEGRNAPFSLVLRELACGGQGELAASDDGCRRLLRRLVNLAVREDVPAAARGPTPSPMRSPQDDVGGTDQSSRSAVPVQSCNARASALVWMLALIAIACSLVQCSFTARTKAAMPASIVS
jgi:hypothetical protein